MKKIIIGSDKSGFRLKEAVKIHLQEQGYEVIDAGSQDEENAMFYYEVARNVAPRVSSGEFARGILICGTGMGMAVVANKYQNVYAAVCENTYAAEKSRAINDANILTMGGWITGEVVGCAIADAFLKTEFTQDLEEWRATNLRAARSRVKELEEQIYGGGAG